MPSYKVKTFLDAIPDTGGIVSALASKVGCDWHTAKKYIDKHSSLKGAWEAECNRVTDKAKHNIVEAIEGGDLQMSKWWVQVKDDEFTPKVKQENTGTLTIEYINDWRNSAEDNTTESA